MAAAVGAVAGAVGVLALVLLGWWLRRRYKRRRALEAAHDLEASKELTQEVEMNSNSDLDTARRPPLDDSNGRPPPSDSNGRPPPSESYVRPPPSDSVERPPPSNRNERPPPRNSIGPLRQPSGLGRMDHTNFVAKDALLSKIYSKFDSTNQRGGSSVGAAARAAAASGSGQESGNSSNTASSRAGSAASLGGHVDMWIVPFQDLCLFQQIGEGSYGRVYLGKWKETAVAVKLLIGPSESLRNLEAASDMALSIHNPVLGSLQEEASLMSSLRHPNIINFLGVCTLPPCIVSEFYSRGSLADVLKEARTSPAAAANLTWPLRLKMAIDAAKGMLYLHSHAPPLVHRDLKSPNLLVSETWQVKVCDFNMSKIMQVEDTASGTLSTNAVTNPRWLAPEVLMGKKHTFASDVFSFGTVLWELISWEVPWKSCSNIWQVVSHITDGGRLEIPTLEELEARGGTFEGLEAYISLIQRCWSQEPRDRPSFGEIVVELRGLWVLACGNAGLQTAGSSGQFDLDRAGTSTESMMQHT